MRTSPTGPKIKPSFELPEPILPHGLECIVVFNKFQPKQSLVSGRSAITAEGTLQDSEYAGRKVWLTYMVKIPGFPGSLEDLNARPIIEAKVKIVHRTHGDWTVAEPKIMEIIK